MTATVPSGPIFDLHARLAPGPDPVGALLATMDTNSITRTAVCAGGVVDLDRLSAQILDGGLDTSSADNEWVLRCCATSAGRLVPFYFANPHEGATAYRQRAADFRGLELSPAVHGVALNDPRVTAFVTVAADAGHPVYLVCLGRAGARTRDLVELAHRFPDVTFVFGHCGVIGIDAHGVNQVAARDNIVAETSGCLTAIARLALARLGADRVVFGTEYPLQHPQVELAKFAALDLTPTVWHQVAWRNAHRLIGAEPS